MEPLVVGVAPALQCIGSRVCDLDAVGVYQSQVDEAAKGLVDAGEDPAQLPGVPKLGVGPLLDEHVEGRRAGREE